ncbi:MAG: phosphate uptake regulator [Candidatus Woesearchaeota archaeon]|jgi:phosphate uptake regulator
MARKLIQLSPSTTVISLPSKWIKQQQLKKGDSIHVTEEPHQLILTPLERSTKKELILDLSSLPERTMWIYLDAAYVAGYDEIIVNTSGHEQHDIIHIIVQHHPGLIVDDESKTRIHLKDIARDGQTDVNKMVTRVFHMIISFIQEMHEHALAKDYPVLVDAKRRDLLINSYIMYAQRLINKYGYREVGKGGLMHTYLKILEIISDKLALIFIAIGENEKYDEPALLEEVICIFQELQATHTKYAQEKIVKFEQTRVKFLEHLPGIDKMYEQQYNEIGSLLFDLEEVEIQLNL